MLGRRLERALAEPASKDGAKFRAGRPVVNEANKPIGALSTLGAFETDRPRCLTKIVDNWFRTPEECLFWRNRLQRSLWPS
jgi:hypothetical protein